MNVSSKLVGLVSLLALTSIAIALWPEGGKKSDTRDSLRDSHSGQTERDEPPAQTDETHGSRKTAPPLSVRMPGSGDSVLASTSSSSELDRATPAQDHPDESNTPGKVIPHPLDQARLAQQEQSRLFADVKAAIAASDYASARELLETYDARFGADEAWSDRREGYQLISDCKQYPSDESRANGQRFVDEQRGSTLRRWVRRACLGVR